MWVTWVGEIHPESLGALDGKSCTRYRNFPWIGKLGWWSLFPRNGARGSFSRGRPILLYGGRLSTDYPAEESLPISWMLDLGETMWFVSYSCKCGPTLNSLKDIFGCMTFCPTTLHPCCGLKEKIPLCPLEAPMKGASGVWYISPIAARYSVPAQ